MSFPHSWSSSIVLSLLLVLLGASSVQSDGARSLFVLGPLATEYWGQSASFGNPLDEPISTNLMLPPDNPWLCEYPPSLENVTAEYMEGRPEFAFEEDIALFVSINGCSAERKARVAAQLQQRITPRIKVLILYSTDPQSFEFLKLQSDNGDNPPELKDIGMLHIPHRYASGIDLRIRAQYEGDDPRITYEGSHLWNFPIRVTALSENAPTAGFQEGDIYWFRIILFSLLIASPCVRACYLWHAGGGRLHWRRDEDGRIVGIQYIPPMPLWLTTGRPAQEGQVVSGVMTEEEFNKLPEISYSGPAPDRDNFSDVGEEAPNEKAPTRDVADGEDVEIDGIKTGETSGSGAVKSSLHDVSSALEERTDEEVGTTAPMKVATSPIASLKSQGEKDESEEASHSKEATPDVKDQNSLSQTTGKSDFGKTWERLLASSYGSVSGILVGDNVGQPTFGVSEGPSQASKDLEIPISKALAKDESPSASDPPVQVEEPTDEEIETMGPNFTKSSMCSICIDEFEPGERLTVLPRCRHAFHKDCIHPWLTERQGCCPFCKTDVVASTQETDSDDSPDNGGVPTHVDIEAPSVEERRPDEILRGIRWSHASALHRL